MMAATAAGPPAQAEELPIKFSKGGSDTFVIRFSDHQAEESCYLTRCRGGTSPDYYVALQDYGSALTVNAVNSALQADKTVCVTDRIPDIVKRHMR